jgi:serine/threonine protein phosphatase 1
MNRTFAVADIHGQYNLWRQIVESLDETDTLYVLGDCGDRGPDGWKIIKEALKDPRVVYIRGNHDQMLLDSWKDEWCGYDYYLWMSNGGYSTFESLMQDTNHEIFLKELARTKLYHCYENKDGKKIHLSHAGFTLMENDEIPNSEDLLWDREHIEDKCKWWSKTNPNDYVVHGHTFCASRSCFSRISVDLNKSHTVGRYCNGYKICIDGRCFSRNQIAMLDLDTLEEKVFYNL